MAFFGLKLSLDLEIRVAHPHQKFQRVPPLGGGVPAQLKVAEKKLLKRAMGKNIKCFLLPRSCVSCTSSCLPQKNVMFNLNLRKKFMPQKVPQPLSKKK